MKVKMEQIMIEQKNLRYDVISTGGGLSGVFAAVAAARYGARTLLLERTGMLGGMNVHGMTLRGIYNRTALSDEFVSILKELGGIYDSQNAQTSSINGETLRLALFRLCRESNVDVLLYSEACKLSQHKGRVHGLTAVAKNTLFQIEAPVVIDATGTGDLVRNAGVWNTEAPLYAYAAIILTGLDTATLCRCWVQAFVQDGFATMRPGTQYYGPLYAESPVCMITICAEPGRCLVEFPIGCEVDPVDPVSRTQAIAKVHRHSYRLLEVLSKTPGFENVRLSVLPPQLVLRQMRLNMTLTSTVSDIPSNVVAVAIGETGSLQYFSLDDLALAQPSGLMVCGRLAAASAYSERYHIGISLATGESAGVCGALAAQKGCLPREVASTQIREALKGDHLSSILMTLQSSDMKVNI